MIMMEPLLEFNLDQITKMLEDHGYIFNKDKFKKDNVYSKNGIIYKFEISKKNYCRIDVSYLVGDKQKKQPFTAIIKFFKNGKVECDWYPAETIYICNKLVVERYYKDNRLHNENGPAIICWENDEKACESYIINGAYSRFDGPAYIDKTNNIIEYYIEDNKISESQYWKIINGIKENKLNVAKYKSISKLMLIKKAAQYYNNNFVIEYVEAIELANKLCE